MARRFNAMQDLNDHHNLRNDPAIQTAVNRFTSLASRSTLCRLENRAERNTLVAVHEVMAQQFIASYKKPPRKLVLDFDATDDRVHGLQQGRFFFMVTTIIIVSCLCMFFAGFPCHIAQRANSRKACFLVQDNFACHFGADIQRD